MRACGISSVAEPACMLHVARRLLRPGEGVLPHFNGLGEAASTSVINEVWSSLRGIGSSTDRATGKPSIAIMGWGGDDGDDGAIEGGGALYLREPCRRRQRVYWACRPMSSVNGFPESSQ